MPWHIPEDLRYFRDMTLGKVVLMGQNTFSSIGAPLHQRINLVVSSKQPTELKQHLVTDVPIYHNDADKLALAQAQDAPCLYLFNQLDAALETGLNKAQSLAEGKRDLMVIGGATIYEQTVAQAENLYITWIDQTVSGNTYLPDFKLKTDWILQHERAGTTTAAGEASIRFCSYTRPVR